MTGDEYQQAGSLMASALERWNLPRPIVVVYSSQRERALIANVLRDDANQTLVDAIHDLGPARYGGGAVNTRGKRIDVKNELNSDGVDFFQYLDSDDETYESETNEENTAEDVSLDSLTNTDKNEDHTTPQKPRQPPGHKKQGRVKNNAETPQPGAHEQKKEHARESQQDNEEEQDNEEQEQDNQEQKQDNEEEQDNEEQEQDNQEQKQDNEEQQDNEEEQDNPEQKQDNQERKRAKWVDDSFESNTDSDDSDAVYKNINTDDTAPQSPDFQIDAMIDEKQSETVSNTKSNSTKRTDTNTKATTKTSKLDDRVLVASRMIFEVPRTELQHVQFSTLNSYQAAFSETSAPAAVKRRRMVQAIQSLASDCELQNSFLAQACESRSFLHNIFQLYGSMEQAVQSTMRQYSVMPRVAQSPNDGDIGCLVVCSLLIDAQVARRGAGVLVLSRLSHLIAPVVHNPCPESELTVLLKRLLASTSTVYPALAASIVAPAIQGARSRTLSKEILWQLKAVLQDTSIITDAFSHQDASALSVHVDQELQADSSPMESRQQPLMDRQKNSSGDATDTNLSKQIQELVRNNVRSVKGDGNCLFYALLNVTGEGPHDSSKAMQLRATIVDYIQEHRDIQYEQLHPKSRSKNTLIQEVKENINGTTDVDAYLENMKNSQDAYGGRVELVVGSVLLKLCVYLFVNRNSTLSIDPQSPYGTQDCNSNQTRFFRYTLSSPGASTLHYDLVEFKDPTTIIQQLEKVLSDS